MPDPVVTTEQKIDKLYEIFKTGTAPAVVGKPVWEDDLNVAKACGAKDLPALLGHKETHDENVKFKASMNFGRKSHTSHAAGMMTDEVRLRLFQFKKMFHLAEVQAQIATRNLIPGYQAIMDTPAWRDFVAPMCKAFNLTDFSNWVPTVNARFYFEEFEIPNLLADVFDTQPMDSLTVNVPGHMGLLEGQLESDAGTFTEQTLTQAQILVTAKNNVCHTAITEDLMQDSAPSILDTLRKNVIRGCARAFERALVRGDTSGTHQDSDLDALPKTYAKAFKGMVRKARDAGATHLVDHANATPDKALFRKMLLKTGIFGSEKGDLRWVFSSMIANDLVTGAIPELFTAYAFGERASNVTGQVPPVFGIQGVESEYMRDDLNASGVYDGVTVNRSSLILVKVSRFNNFLRAPLRVWAAPSLPSSDRMLMTAKIRQAWNGNPQGAEEKSVIYGYNIAQS